MTHLAGINMDIAKDGECLVLNINGYNEGIKNFTKEIIK